MNKGLSQKGDQFLVFLIGAFKIKNRLNRKDFLEAGAQMKISKLETSSIIDILIADGLLSKHIKSLNGIQIVDYSYNPAMTKFIFDNEGYKKKRVKDYRESVNTTFAFYRNWIWLIFFIIGFLLYAYQIINYIF